MPYKISPGLLQGVEIFLESTEDFEGLWNGLYLVMWEYLQNNIDEGVAEEIRGEFLGDFNNLMELVWLLHELTKKEEE
jgi:hypothetical protein